MANTLGYFTSSSVTKKKFYKIDYIHLTRKASQGQTLWLSEKKKVIKFRINGVYQKERFF